MTRVSLVIHGEPASKANSREIVQFGGIARLRKSDKALEYEAQALRQIPPKLRVQLVGPVRVFMRIYYASERPDLDESLLLDVLQDRFVTRKGPRDPTTGEPTKIRELVQKGVYRNDRQVREKHVFHAIDKAHPRTEIVIETMQAQQESLL